MLLLRRSIHSAVAMTSQEVATALRPFIFTVHPDRFWNHPKEKTTNEISLKRLNEFLGDKSQGRNRFVNDNKEETIIFYVRQNNKDDKQNQNKSTTTTTAASSSTSNTSEFEKIHIKLNSNDNLTTTVHRILSQCSLPTDYLNKINNNKSRIQSTSINANFRTKNHDSYQGRQQNEYFYTKIIFDDMESAFFRSKMELNLIEWLKQNHQLALKKLEASLPIKTELERLKQELIDELKLNDLKWNCDWTVSHIRGALKNLSILSKQYPDELRRLKSRTVIFSRQSGVSFEGQVVLNMEDVRNNWLYLIRSIDTYDYFIKNLPILEKELSELLGGITITHPEYNLWNVKRYFKQLTRLIKSIKEFQCNHSNSEFLWPERMDGYRLIVEFDSGPLMLSPNGDFIVPASCPITLLIKFILENLNKANKIMDQEEFNCEHERILHAECMTKFGLRCLEKDVNITSKQMIQFCRKILDNRNLIENYLRDSHIQVSMYYSVMHDGQMCLPYNFFV